MRAGLLGCAWILAALALAAPGSAQVAALQVVPDHVGNVFAYSYALHGETAHGIQDVSTIVTLTRTNASSLAIRERSKSGDSAVILAQIADDGMLAPTTHVDPADLPAAYAAIESGLGVVRSMPAGAVTGASWNAKLAAAAVRGVESAFPVTITATAVSAVSTDLHLLGTRTQTIQPASAEGDAQNGAGNADFSHVGRQGDMSGAHDSGPQQPFHIKTTVEESLHFTDGRLTSAEGSITATADGAKTVVDLAWSLERDAADESTAPGDGGK
jgi:hypothetical protein